MRYKNRGYLYLFIIISMSQVTPSEREIIKEAGVKVAEWARYDAAFSEFEKLRDIMIKDIMQMDIPQGADFYSMLQNKIHNFKEGETLKRIVRSVVTGQALDEISHKYIEENVVRESQNNKKLTQQPKQEEKSQSIENMIQEKNKIIIMSQVQKDANIQNLVQESNQQKQQKQKIQTVTEKPSEPQTEQEAVKEAEKPSEPQEAVKEAEKSTEPQTEQEAVKEAEKSTEPQTEQEEEKPSEPQEAVKEEEKKTQINNQKVEQSEEKNKILVLKKDTPQFDELYNKMLEQYKDHLKKTQMSKKQKKTFRDKFIKICQQGINQQAMKLQTFLQ